MRDNKIDFHILSMDLVTTEFYGRVRVAEALRGSRSRYQTTKLKGKEGTRTPHSTVRVRCSAAAARTPQGPCPPVLGPQACTIVTVTSSIPL